MFDVSYIGTKIKLATPTGGHEIRFIYFCRGFSRDGSTKYYFDFICFCLVCCFTSQATATCMVIAGQSVHLATLFFLCKLEQAVNMVNHHVNQCFVHILPL